MNTPFKRLPAFYKFFYISMIKKTIMRWDTWRKKVKEMITYWLRCKTIEILFPCDFGTWPMKIVDFIDFYVLE